MIGYFQVYAAAREMESQIEYDENDMPILKDQKEIEPLPPVDHSTIEYYEFRKDFYREDKEIAAMGPNELMIMHKQLEIKVSGFDCPNPVCFIDVPSSGLLLTTAVQVSTFEQLRLGKILMGAISKHGYTKPTPIQVRWPSLALITGPHSGSINSNHTQRHGCDWTCKDWFGENCFVCASNGASHHGPA